MSNDLSVAPTARHFPLLLVIENDFSAVDPLIRTFDDPRLDFDYQVCTSHRNAMRKLLMTPYQMIISGAHLAEMDDFSLLEQIQARKPFVPFVVSANDMQQESARLALERGAFDAIIHPLDHEQTVRTLRLALWHTKLSNLIARKEAVLALYSQHLADYPEDKQRMREVFCRAIMAFEKSLTCLERTIEQMEETTMFCFSDFATKMEHYTRTRALERLDTLRT